MLDQNKIRLCEKDNTVIADCTKCGTGKSFQLRISKSTLECTKRPPGADIDASAAYARICQLMRSGNPLPERAVSAWG